MPPYAPVRQNRGNSALALLPLALAFLGLRRDLLLLAGGEHRTAMFAGGPTASGTAATPASVCCALFPATPTASFDDAPAAPATGLLDALSEMGGWCYQPGGFPATALHAAGPAAACSPPWQPPASASSGTAGEADSGATLRHRTMSFVLCVARSPVLKSALVSLEEAGAHPPAYGAAGRPAAQGLEWTLAQLLALHLRTGEAEGKRGSQDAMLGICSEAQACSGCPAGLPTRGTSHRPASPPLPSPPRSVGQHAAGGTLAPAVGAPPCALIPCRLPG